MAGMGWKAGGVCLGEGEKMARINMFDVACCLLRDDSRGPIEGERERERWRVVKRERERERGEGEGEGEIWNSAEETGIF